MRAYEIQPGSNSLDGVKKDMVRHVSLRHIQISQINLAQAHYETYGKPIWVTEFACVDGTFLTTLIPAQNIQGGTSDNEKFEPCTDQSEINTFINEVVDYFEGNPKVFAYAYSNGLGLGDVWPLMKGSSLR